MVFHEHIVEDDATTHTDLILQSHTVLKYGRGQAPEPGEETFIAPSSPVPIHRNPEISMAKTSMTDLKERIDMSRSPPWTNQYT
jgi:hypothetical protein